MWMATLMGREGSRGEAGSKITRKIVDARGAVRGWWGRAGDRAGSPVCEEFVR